MKSKNLTILSAVCLAMVSSACQKTALTEISPGVSSQGITFELMTAPQTKVTTDAGFKTVFDEGDEVGLYVVQHASGAEGELLASGNLHDNLKLVLRGGVWVLDGSTQIYFPENDNVLDFYAYWPYSETVDPTALTYNASESSYDLLAAVNADVAKTSEPVKLVFDHLLALVEVNVEGRGEAVTIKNVIPDAVFNIAGKPAILGNTPSDVEMPAVSESFRLYLPAQTLSKGELFYIKAGDQDSKYTNAADRSLLAGTALQYNIDTQLGDIDAMPNCYMLKPGETVEIPVTKAYEVWKQESYLGPAVLTGDPEAEFLWMDAEGLVTSMELVSDPDDKTRSKIKVAAASGKEGNALVGVRIDGEMRWAWHIWVTEYDPDGDGKTYDYHFATSDRERSFIFMDRNLGAVTSDPREAGSIGLYYQGMRNIPFPGPQTIESTPQMKTLYKLDGSEAAIKFTANSDMNQEAAVQYSLKNPTAFIYKPSGTTSWLSAASAPASDLAQHFWSAQLEKKRLYDPCPEGWTLPSRDGTGSVGQSIDPYDCVTFIKGVSSTSGYLEYMNLDNYDGTAPYGYFPLGGRMHYQTGKYDQVGKTCMLYIGEYDGVGNTRAFEIAADKVKGRNGYGRASGLPVRCVREFTK